MHRQLLWNYRPVPGYQQTAVDLRRKTFRVYPASHLKNLVVVVGHAVYSGLDYHESDHKESWYLLDYQRQVPAGGVGPAGLREREQLVGLRSVTFVEHVVITCSASSKASEVHPSKILQSHQLCRW